MLMGVLYVVATPIGNLEDITLRALRVLREVKWIAAEDTRTTAKLLAHYGIHTRMVSFFDHNELVRLDEILRALEGQDVALVSEAGMPTISDPGYRLVLAAIAQGTPVVAVPGPSSVVAALAVSGLPTDSFLFIGFLSRRQIARAKQLAAIADQKATIVCFEAPHRLLAALQDIREVLGDRRLALACELTKMYEEVWRGTVGGAVAHFSESPPRGEYTLVLAGAAEELAWDEARVNARLTDLIQSGVSRRDAAARIATLAKWPKRSVYRLATKNPANTDTKELIDG
jgi:16S rRNA (cytidine1402-2'-O)-methyltransferase